MATLTARVGGMTCGACVRNVEQALGGVPGARSVRVDLAAREAVVEHDGTATVHAMRAAVEAAGFTLEPARGLPAPIETLRTLVSRPAVVGPVAALVLLGVYLGLISLAQGWDHALQQFEQDRPFVLLLAAGFGVQASLYMRLRARHARAAAGGASMAASGGTSTAAMLACCAHHLTEILPILGRLGAGRVSRDLQDAPAVAGAGYEPGWHQLLELAAPWPPIVGSFSAPGPTGRARDVGPSVAGAMSAGQRHV